MELQTYLTPDCLRPPKPTEKLFAAELSDLKVDKWNLKYGLKATVQNAAVQVVDHFGVIDVRVADTEATLHVGYLSLSEEEVARRYPEGAIILIKSPYLFYRESSVKPQLLVGHPDAAIIDLYLPRYVKARINLHILIDRGRTELRLGRYLRAVEIFEIAAKKLKKNDERFLEVTYLAADALFRSNMLEASVQKASRVFRCPVHSGYFHRTVGVLGRAQLGMGFYSRACCYLSLAMNLAEDGPEKREYVETLGKAVRLKQQNQTGVYANYLDFLTPETVTKVLNEEVAEYIGPVEIRLGKYGRGVFVTRGVKLGELLMVCKPIVASECPESEPETHELNVLVSRIVHACSVSRRALAQVNSMQSDPSESDTVPPMEYFRPGRVRFKALKKNSVDINHVKGVLTHNRSVFFNTANKKVHGLWGLSSFINHACSSNVSVMVVGDIVFVIASKCLSAQTELLRNYHQRGERQKSAMPCVEQKLACSRCALVAQEPWRDLALKYKEEFLSSGNSPGWVSDHLEAELAVRKESLSKAEFAKLRPLRAAFAWSYTTTLDCDLPTAISVMADISEYSSGERFSLSHLLFKRASEAWRRMVETATEQVPETGHDQAKRRIQRRPCKNKRISMRPKASEVEENETVRQLWFGSLNQALLRERGIRYGDTQDENEENHGERVMDPLSAILSHTEAFVATFGQMSEAFISMIPEH